MKKFNPTTQKFEVQTPINLSAIRTELDSKKIPYTIQNGLLLLEDSELAKIDTKFKE